MSKYFESAEFILYADKEKKIIIDKFEGSIDPKLLETYLAANNNRFEFEHFKKYLQNKK